MTAGDWLFGTAPRQEDAAVSPRTRDVNGLLLAEDAHLARSSHP